MLEMAISFGSQKVVTSCLLISVCFNFPDPKSPFWIKQIQKARLISIKYNFLKKIVFLVCEENAQFHKGAQRCISKKSLCVLIYICWTHRAITKLPFNKLEDALGSHAQIPHSSHLISLLCPLPWSSLSRHPLLLLSSSSSMRIPLYIYIYIF